ncbi:MAG: pyruvate formate lyase family protein [Kiritimatiellia bacterium]|jgi:hypothetical protein
MTLSERFRRIGEYYAAGLYEDETRPLFTRKARALRRYYEQTPLPPYGGGLFYPCSPLPCDVAVRSTYLQIAVDWERLEAADPALKDTFAKSDFFRYQSTVPWQHSVAGNMYTHSTPNYERVLAEGLDGYEARVKAMEDDGLRDGLLDLLAGIRAWHGRLLAKLRSENAAPRLVAALERVPFAPARDFYEAMVCWNFVFFLDGCDNEGCLADGLAPYYDAERDGDPTPVLREWFKIVDATDAYSMAVGMTPNPLVLPCLRAVRGLRRPMIELLVGDDTSDEIWDEALDCILAGGAQPSFYNRRRIVDGLLARFPEIRREDVSRFCGGGCTETMLAGLSNVGSLDAGINLPFLFEKALQARLAECATFDDFYRAYLADIAGAVDTVTREIANSQAERARWNPLPMRTLLVDDCIANERDFNDGGARYAWSLVSFAGIVNAVDSLLALREHVYRRQDYTKEDFLAKLAASDPDFLRRMKACPVRHGINHPQADALAGDFTREIFGFLRNRKPHFGLGFLPASILFVSYGQGGRYVGATPDGRAAGEALADSLCAIYGKDTLGPTALLKSVAAMDLPAALGIPVLNLTLQPGFGKPALRALIEGFFSLGGMQVQITCLSRDMLEEAEKNLDGHRNLIVRVGGYAEYYHRLDDEVRAKIRARTFHAS